MLFEVIQGSTDVIVDAKAPRNPEEIFHGEMVGIFKGDIDDNGVPIATKVSPRKFFVVGSYALIEFKGVLKEDEDTSGS